MALTPADSSNKTADKGDATRVLSGRYRLYRAFAIGGMGEVRLGEIVGARGFHRVVAVKCVRPDFATDPAFAAMLHDEANIVSRIRHANVVPVLDLLEEDEHLYLVMEYVHGEPLSRLVLESNKRGEMVPAHVAIKLVVDMLEGLHAAHDARSITGELLNVVHRDISPQNLLVGVDGVGRVLDFGIAKAVGRSRRSREGELKGKMAYMAPEQLRGKNATKESDIYAAAIVLWELLAGRRYHAGLDQKQIVQRTLNEPPISLTAIRPDLSSALDALITQGLAKDPARRFGSAQAMANALRGVAKLATPNEVGRLVSALAKETLDTRAKMVDEIDRRHTKAPPPPMTLEEALSADAVAELLEGLGSPRAPTPDVPLLDFMTNEPSETERPSLRPPPLTDDAQTELGAALEAEVAAKAAPTIAGVPLPAELLARPGLRPKPVSAPPRPTPSTVPLFGGAGGTGVAASVPASSAPNAPLSIPLSAPTSAPMSSPSSVVTSAAKGPAVNGSYKGVMRPSAPATTPAPAPVHVVEPEGDGSRTAPLSPRDPEVARMRAMLEGPMARMQSSPSLPPSAPRAPLPSSPHDPSSAPRGPLSSHPGLLGSPSRPQMGSAPQIGSSPQIAPLAARGSIPPTDVPSLLIPQRAVHEAAMAAHAANGHGVIGVRGAPITLNDAGAPLTIQRVGLIGAPTPMWDGPAPSDAAVAAANRNAAWGVEPPKPPPDSDATTATRLLSMAAAIVLFLLAAAGAVAVCFELK